LFLPARDWLAFVSKIVPCMLVEKPLARLEILLIAFGQRRFLATCEALCRQRLRRAQFRAGARAAGIRRRTTICVAGGLLAARTIRAQAMASERASWWSRAMPSFRQTSDSLVGRMFQARRAI